MKPPASPGCGVPPTSPRTRGQQDGGREEGELLVRQLQAAQGPPQLEDGANEVVAA